MYPPGSPISPFIGSLGRWVHRTSERYLIVTNLPFPSIFVALEGNKPGNIDMFTIFEQGKLMDSTKKTKIKSAKQRGIPIQKMYFPVTFWDPPIPPKKNHGFKGMGMSPPIQLLRLQGASVANGRTEVWWWAGKCGHFLELQHMCYYSYINIYIYGWKANIVIYILYMHIYDHIYLYHHHICI